MKITLVIGIIVGLVTLSAEATENCDGPVLMPGYTAGSCNCVASTPGGASGGGIGSCNPSSLTIGFRNDYYTCGGNGYTYCYVESATVGYVNPGCVDTPNFTTLATLIESSVDCERLNNGTYSNPPSCTFSWCDWNSCAMATSGGTPITANVLNDYGDYTGCMMAKLKEPPSPSVVELALVTLKKSGK